MNERLTKQCHHIQDKDIQMCFIRQKPVNTDRCSAEGSTDETGYQMDGKNERDRERERESKREMDRDGGMNRSWAEGWKERHGKATKRTREK